MPRNLRELEVFVSVAQKKNFTLAGHAVQLSASAVSKYISGLEHSLGVPLLHRSTHYLFLTEAVLLSTIAASRSSQRWIRPEIRLPGSMMTSAASFGSLRISASARIYSRRLLSSSWRPSRYHVGASDVTSPRSRPIHAKACAYLDFAGRSTLHRIRAVMPAAVPPVRARFGRAGSRNGAETRTWVGGRLLLRLGRGRGAGIATARPSPGRARCASWLAYLRPQLPRLRRRARRLVLFPQPSFSDHKPGAIGAVFQSGGILQFWLTAMAARGAGFSYAVSSGNEIDLDLADYVNFLVNNGATPFIVLFVEGIPDRGLSPRCGKSARGREAVPAPRGSPNRGESADNAILMLRNQVAGQGTMVRVRRRRFPSRGLDLRQSERRTVRLIATQPSPHGGRRRLSLVTDANSQLRGECEANWSQKTSRPSMHVKRRIQRPDSLQAITASPDSNTCGSSEWR